MKVRPGFQIHTRTQSVLCLIFQRKRARAQTLHKFTYTYSTLTETATIGPSPSDRPTKPTRERRAYKYGNVGRRTRHTASSSSWHLAGHAPALTHSVHPIPPPGMSRPPFSAQFEARNFKHVPDLFECASPVCRDRLSGTQHFTQFSAAPKTIPLLFRAHATHTPRAHMLETIGGNMFPVAKPILLQPGFRYVFTIIHIHADDAAIFCTL